jgi:hypothetical protein
VTRKQNASPEEAAAIAAAVERFLAETAPAAPAVEDGPSPWQRAALIEGVRARRTTIEHLEGGMR